MRVFILTAHGSRVAVSNSEIAQLAEKLSTTLKNDFDLVEFAFMEKAEPDLNSKLAEIKAKGATEIVILPYLLARGFHVASQIPELIESFSTENPGISVILKDHIGGAAGMTNLIREHVCAVNS